VDNRVDALPGRHTRRGGPVYQRGRDPGRPLGPGSRGRGEHPRRRRYRAAGDHDPHSRHTWGRDRGLGRGRSRRDRHRRDPRRAFLARHARPLYRGAGDHRFQRAQGLGERDRGQPPGHHPRHGVLPGLLLAGRGGRPDKPPPGAKDRPGRVPARRLRALRDPDHKDGKRRHGGGAAGQPHPMAFPLGGADVGRHRPGRRDGRGDGLRRPLLRRRGGPHLHGHRHPGRPHSPGAGPARHGAAREVQLRHLAEGKQGHFGPRQHHRCHGLPEHHPGLRGYPVHPLEPRFPEHAVCRVRPDLRRGVYRVPASQRPAARFLPARRGIPLLRVPGGRCGGGRRLV
ncbi:MAG: Sodium/calcium exchanger membrane region, partial [uncultured Rubrobacteraceae bacterium]